MHGQKRGWTSYKLGMENKNWEATSKGYNGHLAAHNSDFSKLVKSKLESDAQEVMHSQREAANRYGGKYFWKIK